MTRKFHFSFFSPIATFSWCQLLVPNSKCCTKFSCSSYSTNSLHVLLLSCRISATFFDNSPKTTTKVFLDLFSLASSRKREVHKRLLSVCSYSTFPFGEDDGYRQTSFLLGLYSHIMSQQMDSSVFSFIDKILHKTPKVWKVDFSVGNIAVLPQVLELQVVKRPVEVRGWPKEERTLKDFLLCLPHMPKLR